MALWFRFLPADRWAREQPPGATPADAPVAFVEKQRGAMRIAALDPRATALGLSPGMALADARACVPDLIAVDHDPAADHRLIERIADICDRYTPMVAIDPPDGVTLDITGCAHLFGGEAAMTADIEARMVGLRLRVRHAAAATPEGAQALARFQTMPAADEAAALRRLPIAALRLEEDAEIALRRAGLKTIGDLAARPTAPLAARFGDRTVSALDRLLGRVDSRITPLRPPPALFFERRFADPIVSATLGVAVIGELAEEAARILAERRAGGRRFAARFYRSDGAVRDLAVETSLPTRDPGAIMRLFEERVAGLADPIDPGFGFDMIRLAVPGIEPLAPSQLRLEGGAANEEALAALVDRLSTRLGRGRIRRFMALDTHIPEQGVLALPAIDAAAPAAWPRPEQGEPPLRPLHLFDPPQPVEVVAEVPDGPPHRFRWRRTLHEVRRFEGPERIAAEWWRRKDNHGLTRDYYRVEDARGRRFWLFRHGLYESERPDPRWYVHGLFA
ncbi:Y-family DNA polymerase [Sphingomonas gilva]|nr:DNA polymerase Y family protein [Sphingomonas gilva]